MAIDITRSAQRRAPRVRRAATLAAFTFVAGCATFNPAQDAPHINALLDARGARSAGWERNGSTADVAQVSAWLAQPMTVDTAVRVAMIRSPRLQRTFGQIGLARADVLQALTVANPRFMLERLPLDSGPGTQLGLGLVAPLVDLLVAPARHRLARMEYERARYAIAAGIINVGQDVEADWYRYVGAQQVADMRAASANALKTSADLAQRFFDAGNISELQFAREQAAASEARIAAARAAVDARLARLDLNTVIGLTGAETEWRTSAVLPLPVAREDDPAELRRIASTTNLDLLAARKEEAITAGSARVTKAFRLLGGTEIGYYREEGVDRSVIRGPTLSLELPIFNQGGARVARAFAQLQLARAKLAELELTTNNAVDLSEERVRVFSDIVRVYREALVPQREIVARRSQDEENYMFIGEFEVLLAKAQEYDAYQGFLQSVRDYWLARVDLMRVVGSRLPSERQPSANTPSVQEILTPSPPAPMHMGHGGHGGTAGMDQPAHGTAPAPTTPHDHGAMGGMAMPPPIPAPTPTPTPTPEHHHGGDPS